MSKKKRTDEEMVRFFVTTSPEARKALMHLAIDLNMGVERLGGKLLAEAVERASADFRAGKLKPEKEKD